MHTKLAFARATRLMGIGLFSVALASPFTAWSQEDSTASTEAAAEGDAVQPNGDEPAPLAVSEPAATTPDDVPAPASATSSVTPQAPEALTKPAAAAPAAPPPPAPSPFQLSVKGVVTGSVMLQENPTRGIPGGSTLFGPTEVATDPWFWNGDVRQTQLNFFINGPQIGMVKPMAGITFDLLGGHQINTVPGNLAAVMGVDGSTVIVPSSASSNAQGDENILPRVRLAYLELQLNEGADIIRIGQYHNLIVPMIAASLSHIGAPLGYGAGQLGWRAPGLTYQHTFKLSEETNLAASLQINRNSWADNIPSCSGEATAADGCLPHGVSLGEASGLPQVQARLLLSGPPKASPFPLYAPNAWQLHLVGVWDQKDLDGVGAEGADTRDTMVASGGFKFTLGPVLLAGHAWYGKNAGSMFGHIFQMQGPTAGDITGFGAWGQVGVTILPNVTLWAFGGIDKPDEDDIRDALSIGYVQNAQLVGMISYVDGPLAFSLEALRVMSELVTPASDTPISGVAHQISATGAFFF